MKKILVTFLLVLSFFATNLDTTNAAIGNNGSTKCGDYNFDDDNANVGDALDKCLSNSELVKGTDVDVKGGFGDQIKRWTENISLYLGVLAVASIVIGALMLTLSAGEEEKIKKAKDVIKWGIIGFLGIVVASTIITLIIKIVYSL